MKIVDIHTHGGFGINFNTADIVDLHVYAKKALEAGINAFCPTLATDSVENISRQLSLIKEVMNNQRECEARILGVHLEACFLNPQKCGIHNKEYFLDLTTENFNKIENSDVIKIVTLSPELDGGLMDFLYAKGIKVQAGHTTAQNANYISATTHHFNAMPTLHHRNSSITLDALLYDDIYCEIIPDMKHVSLDMLNLFFKVKNKDKIILISDSLPIAGSDLEEIEFCSKIIYKDGKDKDGCLAGSVMLLPQIAENVIKNGLLPEEEVQKMVWDNPLSFLEITP